jgi:hypothetical protein
MLETCGTQGAIGHIAALKPTSAEKRRPKP